MKSYRKISTLKSLTEFSDYARQFGFELNCDEVRTSKQVSALGQSIEYQNHVIGNRWCILPMEGWDCLPSGAPSEFTSRRWRRFGGSGAKLLFGCEAAAVMHEGRSSSRQMMISSETVDAIAFLRREMVEEHRKKFSRSDDLCIGLQLTHSGRFAHPEDNPRSGGRTVYAHPLLDKKFGNDISGVLSDREIKKIIERFVAAAKLAYQAGFDFVDIKHAHGYLAHELLSAVYRPGNYGGSFENRTRFLREIVDGIKNVAPSLQIAVRLSLFDFLPYETGADGVGKPMEWNGEYPYAFGGDGSGHGYDLTETVKFIKLAKSLGINMICASVGSPYYNPHIQRPAYYPVVDGYLPPEDPLCGVIRHIKVVAEVKRQCPDVLFVGSGYTYLQEWLPTVAEYAVANNLTDFVGIGRMALAYPEICSDTLSGIVLDRRRICRTFGDCTNAPRNGLISGCYPLDEFYKNCHDSGHLKYLKTKEKQNSQGDCVPCPQMQF